MQTTHKGWHVVKPQHNSLPYLPKNLNKSIRLPVDVSTTAGWMANSADSDQMPHFAASDLHLYCLLWLFFCPNTRGKYGIFGAYADNIGQDALINFRKRSN